VQALLALAGKAYTPSILKLMRMTKEKPRTQSKSLIKNSIWTH